MDEKVYGIEKRLYFEELATKLQCVQKETQTEHNLWYLEPFQC